MPEPKRDWAKAAARRLQRLCMRPKVAIALILALFVLTLMGSLFPQMPGGLREAQRAAWLATAKTRYGPRADLWLGLGLFSFARALPFLAVASMLIAATTLCLLKRWPSVWRAAREVSVVYDGRTVVSAPIVYDLADAAATAGSDVLVQQALALRGYRVRTQRVGHVLHLRADRQRWARLGSLATHLAVPLMAMAVLLTSTLAERYDLAIGPHAVAPLGPTGDIMVRNDGLIVLNDAAGEATSYQARVTLIEDGVEIASTLLGVNHPLVVDGKAIYLNSYWGPTDAYGVALVVARDPGYVPFIVSGLLLLLGVTCSLWLNPATVWVRLEGEQLTMWVQAARSERSVRRSLAVRLANAGLQHRSAEGGDLI